MLLTNQFEDFFGISLTKAQNDTLDELLKRIPKEIENSKAVDVDQFSQLMCDIIPLNRDEATVLYYVLGEMSGMCHDEKVASKVESYREWIVRD